MGEDISQPKSLQSNYFIGRNVKDTEQELINGFQRMHRPTERNCYHLKDIQMPNFSKQIVSEKGLVQFFFDRISTANGIKYHVSVQVDKKTSCHFTMEPKDGRWKIVSAPLPPSWVLKLEDELSKEISNH